MDRGQVWLSIVVPLAKSLAAVLTPFQNALLFGCYAFALLAIGTTLFYRRDTN